MADAFVAQGSPRAGAKALDVAADTGALTAPLVRAVGPRGQVAAIDTPALIERLELLLARTGLRHIDLHGMDATPLDFRRDYFDDVLCFYGLASLIDPIPTLRGWTRVTRPAGWSRSSHSALRPLLRSPIIYKTESPRSGSPPRRCRFGTMPMHV